MTASIPVPELRARAAAVTTALAIALALVLSAPVPAEAAAGDNDVVISVIEQSMPAIVTIQAPGIAFSGASDEDPDLPPLPEGFSIPDGFEVPGGSGSGVIISRDGLIITNGHVVGNADEVRVILDDGTVLDGTVTGVDTLTDFAFVDVDAADLPSVPLGESSDLRVGQLAISIGNPLGRFPSSAAVGIVSGLDRSISVFGDTRGSARLDHLIQTDAAVNSGNSGGALFDGDGELIGITTAQAGMAEGIAFALPIDLAKPIIEQALAGEELARPYIGVIYREIDAQVAAEESLPVESGAWIATDEQTGESPVVDGSPADDAGLEAGDIITAVNGQSIDRDHPLDLEVLRYAPGEEVVLSVLRDGQPLQLSATLGERPEDLGR